MGSPATVEVVVQVSQADIDEMLDRYDSGMADTATSNAIAIALRRCLRRGLEIEVRHIDADSREVCLIEGREFALPTEAHDWLRKAECAIAVKEFTFRARLPEPFLRSERRRAPRKAMETSMAA